MTEAHCPIFAGGSTGARGSIMPPVPHIHRRGAVYYWRRRLPPALGLGSHFGLSLRTTNQAFARALAARLDDEMLRMVESCTGDPRLTNDQIKAIFSDVALKHLARLERVAAFDRLLPTFDVEDSRATDKAMGHVYRLLATRGPSARVDGRATAQLKAAGLGDDEIAHVAACLAELRRAKGHVDSRLRLEGLLTTVGAPATPVNLSIAQTTKFRAMSAALHDTRGRWELSGGHDADLLDAIARDAARAPAPKPPAEVVARPMTRPAVAEHVTPAPQAPASPAHATASIAQIAERLLSGRMLNVEEKTKRQVRSSATLFAAYLEEEHGIRDFESLRQEHLAGFMRLLQTEIYIHHGKSVHDEARTLAQLRAIWKTKARDLIGVDRSTAERWAGQLTQLLTTARGEGIVVNPALSFKGLIANTGKPTRARDARPTIRSHEIAPLFDQPAFTGCAASDRLDQPGPHIFHGAVYFASMLFSYGGERREEICGALVTDVILDNGPIPYLYIADNKFRRIKNLQSERPVPIHPELVRLGFLDYVAAIKALGYELLFPDLYSPTSSSPLGDRFHDALRPLLNMAKITAKGTGMHSRRRGFGDDLKQRRVCEEARADLLGHGGASETSERYCSHYSVKILQEEILKLPVVTGTLEPRPINLFPWIAAKQRPPFSYPSRTKTAKRQKTASSPQQYSDPSGHRDSPKP